MKQIKYFSAPWCGPCKTFKPIMQDLQSEGLNIQFINIENKSEMAKDYNVRSVPTCIIEKDGEQVDRWTGTLSKSNVRRRYRNA